jgi:hypothetical protein
MTAGDPGIVTVRTGADEEEKTINILKAAAFRFQDTSRPPAVDAAGLSQQRKQYLFKTVRQYVRPEFQDETCPAPL